MLINLLKSHSYVVLATVLLDIEEGMEVMPKMHDLPFGELFLKAQCLKFSDEFANCNQRLTQPLPPPMRSTTEADSELRCF